MKPASPLPPFAVNICETCWAKVSWITPSELQGLLDGQRYALQDGLVWLHRLNSPGDSGHGVVCDDETLTIELPQSLIQFPISARRQIGGPTPSPSSTEAEAHAAYQANEQVIRLNAALETALASLDQGIADIANTLRDGLEGIALAIRDQGRPL